MNLSRRKLFAMAAGVAVAPTAVMAAPALRYTPLATRLVEENAFLEAMSQKIAQDIFYGNGNVPMSFVGLRSYQ